MKKILIIVLIALFGADSAMAESCAASLMPTFTSAQADELCATFPIATTANTSMLPNADNTLDLGATSYSWRSLYTATSRIAKTSDILRVRQDAQRLFTWDASSDVLFTQQWGDAGTTAAQNFAITASTSDADDDSQLCMSGGGACADLTRGAYLALEGNEDTGLGDATLAGAEDLILSGADDVTIDASADDVIVTATDDVVLQTQGAGDLITLAAGGTGVDVTIAEGTVTLAASTALTLTSGALTLTSGDAVLTAGDLTLTSGAINIPDGASIGAVVQNGANTACDTTCTSKGCFIGYDAGTSAFVACSSALADSCMCAGAAS